MTASTVFAEGFVFTEGGPHKYLIKIEAVDFENIPGFFVIREFDLGGVYIGKMYCSARIPSQGFTTPTYYRGLPSPELVPRGGGWYRLNEYFDIRPEIYVKNNGYLTVPFGSGYGLSNLEPNFCTPPSVRWTYVSGSKGRITFRLTKKLINGLYISQQELAVMYGRIGRETPAFGSEPMVRIILSDTQLTSRDKCDINDGRQTDIDFGPISGVNINGKNHTRPFAVTWKCTQGTFDSQVALKLVGDASSFDRRLIRTSRKDLAVRVSRDGVVMAPDITYNVPGSSGSWQMSATLVSDGNRNISEGEFQASAVIVAVFQ